MSNNGAPLPIKTYSETTVPQANTTPTGTPKDVDQAFAALQSSLPGSVLGVVKGHFGDPFINVNGESIVDVLKFLRDDQAYLCQSLVVIAATDFLKKDAAEGQPAVEPRIEVVYIVYSYHHKHQLTLKVKLPRDNPSVPTISTLYRAANWYERECYDMLGVVFEGHPNHKRILTPPDWVGHPLRKDYVFPEEYNGMKVPL
jgi:NADH-quinone oxidoreductase subunit C